MGRSQDSFSKKEREKKRQKKREEKAAKRAERKAQPKVSGFENMIAYVDEFGNTTDTPPDPTKRIEIKAEDIVLGVPKREKQAAPDPVRTGVIDFFNYDKGFGFIKEKGSGEKFFVHISNCEDEPEENDVVSFEVEKGPKGMVAVKVKKG